MREIEVKARVKDKAALLENADRLGIHFGQPTVQDDTTYETTLPKDDPGWNIFRIRKQAGKTILTMKYKASDRSRDNHERETVVGDAGQVADMLERVGYTQGVHIVKTRQTAKHNGMEVCLDEVKNLGTFVEAEKLTDEHSDVDQVQAELWELLVTLGVTPEDRTHLGYDLLMREFLAKG